MRGGGTGERSAVIHTIIENTKRRGHEPDAYLKGVLELLPRMKTGELNALLPATSAQMQMVS